MNLTELNDLVNNGCITNVAIIEYYTQHVDELSKLSADDLLNMQGSRIVMDYNIRLPLLKISCSHVSVLYFVPLFLHQFHTILTYFYNKS